METERFESNIFFEIHSGLPREGPGSNESTRRAYEMIADMPERPRILDIGCGPGMQTQELARLSGGRITAVDSHQPFLDELSRSADAAGLSDLIGTVNASMDDLQFTDESFDLIWCEGAIFIIGFEEGLKQWKRLLRPGGVLAVTEAAWLKPDPPKEILDFWNKYYPAITTIADNLRMIHRCGYESVGHFALPGQDWWTHYYAPIVERLKLLRAKYEGNQAAQAVLDMEDVEMEMHRRYSEYYGYVFYVMRKPGRDT